MCVSRECVPIIYVASESGTRISQSTCHNMLHDGLSHLRLPRCLHMPPTRSAARRLSRCHSYMGGTYGSGS